MPWHIWSMSTCVNGAQVYPSRLMGMCSGLLTLVRRHNIWRAHQHRLDLPHLKSFQVDLSPRMCSPYFSRTEFWHCCQEANHFDWKLLHVCCLSASLGKPRPGLCSLAFVVLAAFMWRALEQHMVFVPIPSSHAARNAPQLGFSGNLVLMNACDSIPHHWSGETTGRERPVSEWGDSAFARKMRYFSYPLHLDHTISAMFVYFRFTCL